MEGSWRLRPLLFVGVGYCKEESTHPSGSRSTCAISDVSGSWSRRHSTCAISDVFGSWLRRHTTGCCVEGILHWAKEEGGSITSVDRATREEGALSLCAFLFLELQSISRGVAIVSGSIVLAYLLYSLL
jgi:hypothetical protein